MDLSVVVPLMNEEECVRELHRRITEALQPTQISYELIVIDDGSTDATYDILKELKADDAHLRVIKFRRNFGQTAAMQAGFDHARGRVIVSMDGDLQNDPKDIPLLLQTLDGGYDLVCGWRQKRQDKLFIRKVPSMIANRLIGRLTGIRIHDTGCSLKAFKHSAIEKTRLYSDMHRFIPAMMSLSGVRYVEVPVTHHPRRSGSTKYGLSRVWKVLLDLLSIKMLLSFSARPTTYFGLLSLAPFLLGFFFLALSINSYALVAPTAGASLSPDATISIVFPSISFVLLALATHVFLLGILGELICRFSPSKQIDLLEASAIQEWTPHETPPAQTRPPESDAGVVLL